MNVDDGAGDTARGFLTVAHIEDPAQSLNVDRTYVGRMLRLTSLAPDILEAILHGDEPDGLSLEKLRKNLPVRWGEQRYRWG